MISLLDRLLGIAGLLTSIIFIIKPELRFYALIGTSVILIVLYIIFSLENMKGELHINKKNISNLDSKVKTLNEKFNTEKRLIRLEEKFKFFEKKK